MYTEKVSEFSYRCKDGYIHRCVYNRSAQLSTIYHLNPYTLEEVQSLTLLLKDEHYHHQRVCNDFNNFAVITHEKNSSNTIKDFLVDICIFNIKWMALIVFFFLNIFVDILQIVLTIWYWISELRGKKDVIRY